MPSQSKISYFYYFVKRKRYAKDTNEGSVTNYAPHPALREIKHNSFMPFGLLSNYKKMFYSILYYYDYICALLWCACYSY